MMMKVPAWSTVWSGVINSWIQTFQVFKGNSVVHSEFTYAERRNLPLGGRCCHQTGGWSLWRGGPAVLNKAAAVAGFGWRADDGHWSGRKSGWKKWHLSPPLLVPHHSASPGWPSSVWLKPGTDPADGRWQSVFWAKVQWAKEKERSLSHFSTAAPGCRLPGGNRRKKKREKRMCSEGQNGCMWFHSFILQRRKWLNDLQKIGWHGLQWCRSTSIINEAGDQRKQKVTQAHPLLVSTLY